MNIIDDKKFLSKDEKSALLYYLSRPFQFGEYSSLLDMVEALKVKVIVKDDIRNMTIPDELFEARCFWEGRAAQILPRIKPGSRAQTSPTFRSYLECNHRAQGIVNETQHWAELPLMSCYDTTQNCIILYPQTMRDEDCKRYFRAIVPCSSPCDDVMKNETYRCSFIEILLTSFVRSLWRAYFYKGEFYEGGATTHHYYPFVEAPLTEYALLLYLKHTGIPFIHWAYEDTKRMPTCHHYGTTLLHQYVTPKSRERIINFIKSYHQNMSDAHPALIYYVHVGNNLEKLID